MKKDWYHRDCEDQCCWMLCGEICQEIKRKVISIDPLFNEYPLTRPDKWVELKLAEIDK